MVKVYVENRAGADLVAIFADEKAYEACIPSLDKYAAKARMYVTDCYCTDEEYDKFQEIGE